MRRSGSSRADGHCYRLIRPDAGQVDAAQLPDRGAWTTPDGMSAALALILLVEAATSCAAADIPQLAGGATLVRPVGKSEPVPFEKLGPATSFRKSDAIHQTAADKPVDELEAEPADEGEPVDQCEADIHFV